MDTVQAEVQPTINKLKALTRLRSKPGCNWCVFAYALNKDIIKEGKVDDLHAMVFQFGSFEKKEDAETHAKSIIEITGYPAVVVSPYATAVPLTSKVSDHPTEDVPVDLSGKMLKFESDQYKRDKEEFERRQRIEQDIVKEAEQETDPNSLEYFKRQCYLLVKNTQEAEALQKNLETSRTNIAKYKEKAIEHLKTHPGHESQWLPFLKEKLVERGETRMYARIEKGYLNLREDLLSELECPGGVCSVESEDDDLLSESGVEETERTVENS